MSSEAITRFACFGGSCAVHVSGAGPAGQAPDAAARARRRMLAWHEQFSRFEPESELSRLNRDPRETVPVSAVMARLVGAALESARWTGGLVDPTLGDAVERAGYAVSRSSPEAPAAVTLGELVAGSATFGDGGPAGPAPRGRWLQVTVDRRHATVTRPPGIVLDVGGVAKGLIGDILAAVLGGHASFAVDAAGDVRLGGRSRRPRPVQIDAPAADSAEIVHSFALVEGAVATSGLGRRAWRDASGRLGHHLIDPRSGLPAYTGVVQVSALAPTGVEAEARAKAALLSGPQWAPRWLPHGGVIITDDGAVRVLEAAPGLAAARTERVVSG